MRKAVFLLPPVVVALVCAPAAAQQSASYKLTEHVFNAGGHPQQGVEPASASYRITLGSLGEGLVAGELSGASYTLSAGHTGAYLPPGEVSGLRFDDIQTLVWDGEPSVGSYNLYRGAFTDLSGLGYGQCQQQGLPASTTTDTDAPATGAGFFYLVTAVNRLDEEGGKGSGRGGTTCP